MARSRATVHASIWQDPDWRALTVYAQHGYVLLLSQPGLTLAGVLDYLPQRWSDYAIGLDVEAAVAELVDAGFVVADTDTLELCLRTFVRHDLGDKPNKNLVRGMWSAWSAILSERLREVVVEHAPECVWTAAPSAAVTLRERLSERSFGRASERSSERATEPIPTSTSTPMTPSGGRRDERSLPTPPPLPEANAVKVAPVERPPRAAVDAALGSARSVLGKVPLS